MRKIISVVLSVTVIFSLLNIVPFGASAEEAGVGVITNSYDDSGVSYENTVISNAECTNRIYNDQTSTLSYWKALIEDSNSIGANGNAVHFLKGRDNGYRDNGQKWPNFVKIYDSNNENLAFFTPEANTVYKISLKYYSKADNNDYGKPLMLRVGYLNTANDDEATVRDYYNGNIAYINSDTDGWVDAELLFKTGEEGMPIVIALKSDHEWWNDTADVWIDDITVTPVKEAYGTDTTVDFEKDNAFYESSYYGTVPGVAAIKDLGGEHGTVMHIGQMKSPKNNADYLSAFVLTASDGVSPAAYKKGDRLEVSFDININSAKHYNEGLTDFTAALAFGTADKMLTANMGRPNDYINGSSAGLAAIQNEALGWQTYTATVTVPCDGMAAFMLYNGWWTSEADIDIDNIKITSVRNGDVNADNEVDIRDLVCMKKMSAKMGEASAAADLNYDGNAGSADDLSLLRKAILGLVQLPYNKSLSMA